MFVGEPNCGKSVILELVKLVIGHKNVSNIPLHKLGDRFSLAVLSDKALNICAEIKANSLRGIDTFKGIVAGDTLMGEHKGKNAFSFVCRTKLLFAGNTFPQIAEIETGEAFTSRLCFLTFPESIPKDKQDPDLLSRLWDERDAIFSLAMKQLCAFIDGGLKFEKCAESLGFLEEYHDQQNHILRFLDERCEPKPENKIATRALYMDYQIFCQLNCFKPYPVVEFSQAVRRNANVQSVRFRNGGNPVRGFLGLSLK